MHRHIPPAPGYLVGYSGGKDSLAVLDLVVRTGKPVVAFFMYYIPGLDYTEYWCEFARKRWGVKVLQYPHWALSHDLREGWYRARPMPEIPLLKLNDIERMARNDSGLRWIGYGYKKQDSLERRGMITGWYNKTGYPWDEKRGVFSPIDEWSHTRVKNYLTERNIPIPGLTIGGSNGIGLDPFAMEWLRKEWPDDYRRLLKVFPYAVAQADRAPVLRQWKQTQRQIRRQERLNAKNKGTDIHDEASPA